MTNYQRAKRAAIWRAGLGMAALFLIVTVIGPTLLG